MISGFVHSLSYSPNDQKLHSVVIKLPPPPFGVPIHPFLFLEDGPLRSDMFKIVNLNDFRSAFQTAANFGMKFTILHDRNGKIVTLRLNPKEPESLDASMDPLPEDSWDRPPEEEEAN